MNDNTPLPKPLFAFYSAKAAPSSGTSLYRKKDGKEVLTTFVCDNVKSAKSCIWDDKVFVGVVYEFVREITKPPVVSYIPF